jgi:GNAT superfamily N-acetyltransferase
LIENIALLPDRYGEGIGGMLLEQAETIARSLGVNELRLYTDAKFSTNLSFYARRGFSEFLRAPHVAGGEIVSHEETREG